MRTNYEHPKQIFQRAYACASEANMGGSYSEKGTKLECCLQKTPRCVTDFFWKIVTCGFRQEWFQRHKIIQREMKPHVL